MHPPQIYSAGCTHTFYSAGFTHHFLFCRVHPSHFILQGASRLILRESAAQVYSCGRTKFYSGDVNRFMWKKIRYGSKTRVSGSSFGKSKINVAFPQKTPTEARLWRAQTSACEQQAFSIHPRSEVQNLDSDSADNGKYFWRQKSGRKKRKFHLYLIPNSRPKKGSECLLNSTDTQKCFARQKFGKKR